MRVLLDECLPRGLKRHLAGHDVTTVPEAGWAGAKNGELLRLAASRFDAFITVDRSLVSQQARLPLGVVSVKARSNRRADLVPLAPAILAALAALRAGTVVTVE
jgi:hypothetical protein